MSVSLSTVDGPGDAELIAAVRGGDVDAYGELFARHVEAARRLARQIAGPGDADDLVSDAFTKVLTVLQRGGGPDLAFRAYLLTAVRRLHVDRIRSGSRLRPVDDLTPFDPGLPFHDTAVEGFDNATAARAFASLPERWQMVLWHTEVEQQKPADIAPLLGMSANSVSALAYRAREGLRQAFLSMHAADPDDVDCSWTRDHLGAYVRGGLSRRDAARVDDHLSDCRSCAAVYLELTEVNSGLAALLAPLLLGAAGVGYLSSTGGGAAGAVGAGGLTAAKAWVATHASLTAVGGVALTATAVVAVYAASHLGGHTATPQGSPPAHGAPAVPGSSTHSPGHATKTHRRTGTETGRTPVSPAARVTPAGGSSTAPTGTPTSPALSGDSSAPAGNPSTGTTDPAGPSSSPTDPTSGPTNPPRDVSFTSTPPADVAIGKTYVVSAGGGSGSIAFSVYPSTDNFGTRLAACSIAGNTVTFDHAGQCVIAADQTSKALPRIHDTQTVKIPQIRQTVRISSSVPGNPVVGGATYTVTAVPGATGNPVTFTASGACTASGGTVSFVHADACTVTAHESGDTDYTAATDILSFPVGKGAQTITFTSSHLDPAVVGGTPYVATATSTSGGDVTFSTSSGACTVSGATVTFTAPGACVIDADQPGTPDYNPAPQVSQTVTVSDEVDAVMSVTARDEAVNGKGQEKVTATVMGLPTGSEATLTAHVDSAAHITTDESSCSPAPAPEGGQTFTCSVTSDLQSFVFVATVNKGRPQMTFTLTPTAPLVLAPGSKATATVVLGDPPQSGVRIFARRTQN